MRGYYVVTQKIKDTLEQDPNVNTVNTGIIQDVLLRKADMYPYSHLIVNNSTYNGSTWSFNLSVICMDIVDLSKDETQEIFLGNDNQQDVLNTQLAVINRMLEVLRRGEQTNLYEFEGQPNCEPFIDRFEHGVAGWTVTFDLLIPNDMTVCDEVLPNPPVCDPVTYTISDSLDNVLYSGSVVSGGTLAQVISNATVTNSLGSTLASIEAQGSVELADVNNIDSDGSTVPTPAGVAFTCTPAEDATLTLNTSAFLTVASGSTTDISLIDQNDADITPISVIGSTIKVNVPVAVTGGLSAFPNQSGQTTSYFTDDDGDLQLGRLSDFYTLAGTGSDWFFGHTRRFTGITGGYHNGTGYVDINGNATSKALAFPETIVLDWSLYDPVSGNLPGWQYDPFLFSNTDRATAITSATGFSTASFPTGWRLMGIKFLAELPNDGVIPYLNYPPFSDPLGVALWSSTTQNSNSNVGRILRDDTLLNTNSIFTAGARAFPGRIFNTSEL